MTNPLKIISATFIALVVLIPLRVNAITVTAQQPGMLASAIQNHEQVTALTVTGAIDARDIYFISSAMPSLQQLDMSNAVIMEYSGKPLQPAHTGTHQANAIPPYAFMECTAAEIKLPADTRTIGYAAFAGSQISRLELPEQLTTIEAYAFQSSAITTVTMPNSVTTIGTGAFQKCRQFTHAVMGTGLKEIGANAFEGSGIAVLDFSECTALKQIGPWAFAAMPQLTTVILPTSVTEMGQGAFMCDKALTGVILSDNLGKLPALTLYGTEALASVTIPTATDSIGTLAMGSMTALTSLDASRPNTVPALEPDVWGGTPVEKVMLYVPERLVNHYSTADQWKDFNIEGVSGIDNISANVNLNISISRNGDILHGEASDTIKLVRLIDCTGRIITEQKPWAQTFDIDVAGMPHGVYVMQCIADNQPTASIKISI